MLKIYRSNRIEQLIDALASVLQTPVKSLVEPEWIGIHSQGLRSWLAMEMAKRLGIWAHTRVLFPRDLINALLSRVFEEPFAAEDPFQPDRMTWRIMALLAQTDGPNLSDTAGFESLKAYLSSPGQRDAQAGVTYLKRFQLAQKIAALFDQYLIHRPEMILAWENQPAETWDLDAENRWQPLLWRALADAPGSGHLAARVHRLDKRLRSGAVSGKALPERLSLFGIATLPPLYLNVLSAISEFTDIHLFILSPSEKYWSHIRSQRETRRQKGAPNPDPEQIQELHHFEEGNTLLATLGHLGRDFQNMLEDLPYYQEPYDHLYEDPMKTGYDGQPAVENTHGKSVIAVLQSDILNLRQRRVKAETAPLPIDRSDLAVSVHSCHSPLREVEVLFDLLLKLSDSDPTLNPDEIIVMTPDMERYAPFIDAVFGGDGDDAPQIPYSISDRSMRQETAVVDVFLAIINLAQCRVTVQEVLDILSADVVLKRFQLEPQDIETVRRWVTESGIRWGIDRDHRRAVNQPDFNENTWRFGLERLLLGYAMPGDGQTLFQFADQAKHKKAVLPYDEMEGDVTRVLGRFAHFCELLFDIIEKLRQPHTPGEWRDLLRTIPPKMIARTSANEFWHPFIRDTLDEMAAQATDAASSLRLPDEPLPLNIISYLLGDRLAETASSQIFFQGGVTFSGLLSMRGIPFKIVCLMGMDDGRFPRVQPAIGFDLMAQKPKPGDRSVRNDDRYLFLETLLCVREKLIITYCGQDVQTNESIGPSVVVSELLDEIGRSFILNGAGANTDSIHDDLITRHPLQPYSPKYFRKDIPGLFSYSRLNFESARALMETPAVIRPFATPTPEPEPEKVETIRVDDLVYFYSMPARFYLSRQLGIYPGRTSDEIAEREPLQLNTLEMYSMGQTLLEQAVNGCEPDQYFPFMRAKGVLPPGTPGKIAFQKVATAVAPLATAVLEATRGKPLEPAMVDLHFDHLRLYGKIDALWPEYQIRFRFASIKPSDRLALWIKHLALNGLPDSPMRFQSILFGRKKDRYDTLFFNPVTGEDAREMLVDLIRVCQLGQTAPLRFFPSTSYAYTETLLSKATAKIRDTAAKEAKAMAAARNAWRPYKFEGEDADPSVQRIFCGIDPLEEPAADADMDFKHLAVRVFQPMIEHSNP